jgi:ribosome maturation factor RimP
VISGQHNKNVVDFIYISYNAGVGSPIENRSLKKTDDSGRFCGKDVKVALFTFISGGRKFRRKFLKVERNSNDVVVYLKEGCDTEAIEIGVLYGGTMKVSTIKI